MKRLIRNAYIITLNNQMETYAQGFLCVENGRISSVGSMNEVPTPDNDTEVTDAEGMFLMPGFVNTHTHLPMTMLRGFADDLPLHLWLTEHIFPAEAKLVTPENVRTATRLALVEMIKSGTTCFNDMYFYEDIIAEETKKAGMRGVMNESVIDFPAPGFKSPDEGFLLSENLIRKWQGDPIIHPSVCAHAPYTCSETTLRKARQLADKYGTILQIHVAETRKEVEDTKHRTGMAPVKYLYSNGVLNPATIAAHCVWLDAEETEIFARSGASIAHCPKSNLKLASGIADVSTYLESGITVGIGTDGTASNNTLDMVEEMRFAALLPKVVHYNPEKVNAAQALQMATLNGARALGLEKIIGSIEIGKSADFILVNAGASNIIPVYDPYSAIVYAMNSKNIRSSMVNGEWIMRNRQVLHIDKEQVIEDMKKIADGSLQMK